MLPLTVWLIFALVSFKVRCYERASGPQLNNLTESEKYYANLYWVYNPAERIVPTKLGYRFISPLPERLAGITYVGHAARIRLVLERARKGEALRVGALGGSITFGQSVGGAYRTYASTFVEWLNAALPPSYDKHLKPPHHQQQQHLSQQRDQQAVQAAASTTTHLHDVETEDQDPEGLEAGRETAVGKEQGPGSGLLPAADSSDGSREDGDGDEGGDTGDAEAGTAEEDEDGEGLERRRRRRTLRSLGRDGGSGGSLGLQLQPQQQLHPQQHEDPGAEPRGLQNQQRYPWLSQRHGQQQPLQPRNSAVEAEPDAQPRRILRGGLGGPQGGGVVSSTGAGTAPAHGKAALWEGAPSCRSEEGLRSVGLRAADGPSWRHMRALQNEDTPAQWAAMQPQLEGGTGRQPAAAGDGNGGSDGGRGGGGGGGGGVSKVLKQSPPARAGPASATRRPQHVYVSGAVPGTTSSYMSSCFNHHLPRGVDLVFVEFTVNDPPAPSWSFTDKTRRALERLLRKLLQLPSRPAVVLVNMFAYAAAQGKYWHTAERDFNELASYYGLPSVSLRAAVLPTATLGEVTRAEAKTTVPAVSLGAIFNGGKHHPGRGGHVVVAELLITLALELLHTDSHLRAGTVPLVRAHAEGLDPAVEALLADVAARPLPSPMATENYESLTSTCYVEHELHALVQQPTAGWNWTDEGRGKWGWLAVEPGKDLRFQLNTQTANRGPSKNNHVIVQVAYLQSYSGMGTAEVACVAGCTCTPVVIDAHDQRPVSVTSMQDVQVSQHPNCTVRLRTQGPGGDGPPARAPEGGAASGGQGTGPEPSVGNKFKLMGVVLGEEPGVSTGTVTWVRPETFAMSQEVQSGAHTTVSKGGHRRV